MEVWKQVPGFEDTYEISNQGNLRSIDRVVGGPRGDRFWKGRPVQGVVNGNGGYKSVGLCRGDRRRYVAFHTLVLESFVSPRPEGKVCRHLDGNPLNNRLDNLRWGTVEENSQDSISHGTHYQTAKEKLCSRGHPVEGLNRASGITENRYNCLACQRARRWVQKHPGADMDSEADRYYQEVMMGITRKGNQYLK